MSDTPADLAPRHRPEALAFLLSRRSTPAKTLVEPGPDAETLRLILTAAARTPDHGKLEPWRFLLIRGAAKQALAYAAHDRAIERSLGETMAAKSRDALAAAPLIVAVISSPKPSDTIPEIEQVMSAAAVCLSLLNAALAAGVGANWLTGWAAHDAEFGAKVLGLAPSEKVAGFLFLGTPRAAPPERPRPNLSTAVAELSPGLGAAVPVEV